MTKVLKGKKLDKAIGLCWGKHASGVQINIMDIGKVFNRARTAYEANPTPEAIEASVVESVGLFGVNL